MTERRDLDVSVVDVLVVGAGPAGAVTAIALARQGLDVLVVDEAPGHAHDNDDGAHDNDDGAHDGDHVDGAETEASYDVVLSAAALRGLAAVDATHGLPLHPVDAVELRIGDGPSRTLDEADAAVADWRRLVEALREMAVGAGVRLRRGRVTRLDQRSDGHEVTITGLGSADAATAATTVRARHVVEATGARALGDGRGVASGPEGVALGVACAQRFGGVALGSRVLLVLATPTTIDPREHPTCVWAAPGDVDGTGTIGALRLGGAGAVEPEELLQVALAALGRSGLDLDASRPIGPLASGVVGSDFAPERAAGGGRLRVGGAAGLVNPFSGEGLSFAVESGLLAARSIAEHRPDPGAAVRSYRRRLARTFVGYFEAARHAARRYHLVWRFLAATAGSDRPFFAKARRAILLPDGLGELAATERMDLVSVDLAVLGPFLAACDEVAVTTVRREWPFLARLLVADASWSPHQRLRPAVPFFAALMTSDRPPDIRRATVAAAIELATLGTLAFLGPPSPRPPLHRAVDWGTAATVLAGDFLLSQASRLVAESAPEVSWAFAEWLAELTALRAAQIGGRPHVAATAVFASLLEFPARIGAHLAGAGPEVARAVRDTGHHCGHAFLHVEDVLALRGQRTRLDVTLAALLDSRISSLPDLVPELPEPPLAAEHLASDPRLRSTARARAVDAARAAHDRAQQAIRAIPPGMTRRLLEKFAASLVAPLDRDPVTSAPRR